MSWSECWSVGKTGGVQHCGLAILATCGVESAESLCRLNLDFSSPSTLGRIPIGGGATCENGAKKQLTGERPESSSRCRIRDRKVDSCSALLGGAWPLAGDKVGRCRSRYLSYTGEQ